MGPVAGFTEPDATDWAGVTAGAAFDVATAIAAVGGAGVGATAGSAAGSVVPGPGNAAGAGGGAVAGAFAGATKTTIVAWVSVDGPAFVRTGYLYLHGRRTLCDLGVSAVGFVPGGSTGQFYFYSALAANEAAGGHPYRRLR